MSRQPGSMAAAFLLALVFLALPLLQTMLAPGVSAADVCLAIAAAGAALLLLRERRWPPRPRWLWPVAGLFLWSVAGWLRLSSAAPLPFSSTELAKSLAKLLFYPLAVVLLGTLARRLGTAIWSELLVIALTVHALVGLYVYVAMQTAGRLPYRFLWAGSRGDSAAYILGLSEPLLRVRGMASEPSYLGFVLAGGLTVVYLIDRERRPGWREVISCLAILLTVSLTTYALAAAGLVIVLLRRPRRARAVLLATAAAVLLLLAGIVAPSIRTGLRVGVVERLRGIATGTISYDNLVRLNGSYSAAWLMARASPLFGAGLGNYDVAVRGLAGKLDPRFEIGPWFQGWSMPAYLLGTLGWPGLLLLLALLAIAWRHDWAAAAAIATLAFVDGTFLGAPFWTFLALLMAPWNGDDDPAPEAASAALAAAPGVPSMSARS